MEHFVKTYFTPEGLIRLPLDSRNRVDVEILPSAPEVYIASPALFVPDFGIPSTMESEVDRAMHIHQKDWAESVMMLSSTYSDFARGQ